MTADYVRLTPLTGSLEQRTGVTVQGGVTWAFEFEDQPYFAGFRELATNGIDKAVLNVFRMYGKLGGDWVNVESSGSLPVEQIVTTSVADKPDVDAVAARQEHELDILLWNYHDVDLPAAPASITLKLEGLPEGRRLHAEEFRMDAEHGNAYGAWLKMGSPRQPTAPQINELQHAGELASNAIQIDKAGLIRVLLPRQGVSMLRISWE